MKTMHLERLANWLPDESPQRDTWLPTAVLAEHLGVSVKTLLAWLQMMEPYDGQGRGGGICYSPAGQRAMRIVAMLTASTTLPLADMVGAARLASHANPGDWLLRVRDGWELVTDRVLAEVGRRGYKFTAVRCP